MKLGRRRDRKLLFQKSENLYFEPPKKTNLQLDLDHGRNIKVLENIVGYNFVVQMEFYF